MALTGNYFDGIVDRARRGGDWTSNSNSQLLTFAFAIKKAVDTPEQLLMNNNGPTYVVKFIDTTGVFNIFLYNGPTGGGGSIVFDISSNDGILASDGWVHIALSVNLAQPSSATTLRVNGQIKAYTVNTYTQGETIDWTRGEHNIDTSQTGNYTLSQFYLNNSTYIDFSDDDNIAKFYNNGVIDLGASGDGPGVGQPVLFFRNGDPSDNGGYGGDYTFTDGARDLVAGPTEGFMSGLSTAAIYTSIYDKEEL